MPMTTSQILFNHIVAGDLGANASKIFANGLKTREDEVDITMCFKLLALCGNVADIEVLHKLFAQHAPIAQWLRTSYVQFLGLYVNNDVVVMEINSILGFGEEIYETPIVASEEEMEMASMVTGKVSPTVTYANQLIYGSCESAVHALCDGIYSICLKPNPIALGFCRSESIWRAVIPHGFDVTLAMKVAHKRYQFSGKNWRYKLIVEYGLVNNEGNVEEVYISYDKNTKHVIMNWKTDSVIRTTHLYVPPNLTLVNYRNTFIPVPVCSSAPIYDNFIDC